MSLLSKLGALLSGGPKAEKASQRARPFDDAPEIAPPLAEKRPVKIVQHGETRTDDYAWLRDENWQEVLRDPARLSADIRAHLDAENAYYERMTATESELRKTLVAEMRGRIKEDDSSVPSPDGPFAYGVRYREGGEYAIYYRTPRDGGEETVLFDGDREAEGSEFFDVEAVTHSPDHRLIAYGVDRVGSEYFTIGLREAETGADCPDRIENTSGAAVWAADSRLFFYVERDENQRPKRVKRHIVGEDPAQDALVYEEPDDGFFLSVSKTLSGTFILINSGNQTTSETRFIPSRSPETPPRLIAPRIADELYDVYHHEDHFYILTNRDGAVDFKIMRAPITDPGRDAWTDWRPHEPGTYVLGLAAYKDFLVRIERRNALPRIVVSDYAGEEHEIAFTEAAFALSLEPGYEYETQLTRFTYESPSTPEQIFDYDMATRERVLRKPQEVPSGHDPELYAVERITAPAEDGAEIPVTIIRLKTTPVDGSAPALLYGYGSYGITIPADFSTNRLSLVDRGVVYAIAHIRGGAARGRQWYLDGKLDKKMNTFKDFNRAAETLIERGYAARNRLACYGGSAGGLLVGAAVNLRPDLYAGVIAAVPFVDVLNTVSDAELPLTPPEWLEWGDPITDAQAYRRIAAYSPYENIRDAEYPPILATGGLADYRVTYWEPAKWIARLRDAVRGGPFLLKMNMKAGHAGAAARFEYLDEQAHIYAFALRALGARDAAPVAHHPN